jgi:type III secretion protein Q
MTVQVAAGTSPGEAGSRPPPESRLALPAIALGEVDAINALYRRRPALTFSVAGRAATMTASWPPESEDAAGRYRLDITLDGASGALILSRSLIAGLVAGLDPDQGLDQLDPAHLALLLELALADGLSALEAGLGAGLAINAAHPVHDERRSAASFAFDLAIDGLGASSGELLLQPRHARRLAQLLDRRAAGFVPAVELPVPVSLRVAATTCPVGEIATLSPGDVVMADYCCRQPRTAVAVVAEHLAAPVALTAAGAQIVAPPARIHGSLWEWSMENGAAASRSDVMEKTDLGDIPVKLLFELGRIELSLAEVRQLAPGSVVPMPRPLEEGVDIIANGRRIGRGSLVQIGGSLGVRITRLFHNG